MAEISDPYSFEFLQMQRVTEAEKQARAVIDALPIQTRSLK